MKISIITAVLNGADTIRRTFESVALQSYKDIEHIIVDGGSTDGTQDIIEEYSLSADYPVKVISRSSEGRIYGALNEGIKQSTGDVISILHADDVYTSAGVLERVVYEFSQWSEPICYGDIYYFRGDNVGEVVRRYSAANFRRESLLHLFAPPHPAVFIKRELYDKYGLYSTDYLIAGDFELLVRLMLVHQVAFRYIPFEAVAMRLGGLSTRLKHRIFTNMQEKKRALRRNNHQPACFSVLKRYLYILKSK